MIADAYQAMTSYATVRSLIESGDQALKLAFRGYVAVRGHRGANQRVNAP